MKTSRSRPVRILLTIVTALLAATFASAQNDSEEVIQLEEFQVLGKQLGYHNETATTALKLDFSLLQTPQSVFVINDALIADQQAFRMDQILQNDASVQKRNNFLGAYSSYFIRGFSLDNGANYLRNGRTYFHLAAPPVEILNRVEVVKGPSSVLYGTATPGGMINMNTKSPLLKTGGFLKATLGTDDLFHLHADLGGPIFQDASLAYRMNYIYEHSGYFREFADGSDFEVNRKVFYGALRWRPTQDTTVDFTFDILDDDRPQDTGIVAIGDAVADIPLDRILTQPWSHYNSDVWNINFNIEHRFSQHVTVATGYSFQDYERDRYDNQPRSLDEVTGDMQFRARHRINRWEYQTVFVETELNFQAGPTDHILLIGADYTNVDINNNETASNVNFTTNIFNPITIPDPQIAVRDDPNTGGERRIGVYLQDVISFGPQWHLLVGGRYDTYDDDFSVAGVGQTSETSTSNVTPRLGLLYQPLEYVSVYASYSESFEPNSVVSDASLDNFLEQLDPTTGEQFEFGAKAELFNRNLLLSTAIFRAYRSNIPFLDNVANRLLQRGEQRHQGIEFTATGLLTDNLSLVGSFAYLDAEFTQDDNPALIGNSPSGVADFSASLWAEYQFNEGPLARLSLQGGWFYEDDRPGDDANSFTLDSYNRFDVGLKYVWEFIPENTLTFRLTASNLFDKEYFKGDRRLEVNPERPREIRFSTQYSF